MSGDKMCNLMTAIKVLNGKMGVRVTVKGRAGEQVSRHKRKRVVQGSNHNTSCIITASLWLDDTYKAVKKQLRY